MGGEGEAVGDVLTGSIIAGAIESGTGAPRAPDHGGGHATCRNCGATLTGAFCSACGQAAHIHRSLVSLGHDILHGVFHFEGKIWRTVPELFFHPGRLTRRYIDGERVKFVSPMALFLFTVFLMFAVFSFTGGAFLNVGSVAGEDWKRGNQAQIEETGRKISDLRGQLAAPDLSPDQRADIDRRIADLESARGVMEALAQGDWGRIAEIKEQEDARKGAAAESPQPGPGGSALEHRLNERMRHLSDNPALLLYKLKTTGYKFSWALIPLSVPFLWLLFFWRRDITLYDHAIFATYSISFMMLLLVLSSLAAAAGVSAFVWATALTFAPPVHMYAQLRGAYGLSRFGAFVRLFLLMIATSLVLTIFTLLLVLIGVLG